MVNKKMEAINVTLEEYIQKRLRVFGLPNNIKGQLRRYRQSGMTDQKIYNALVYCQIKQHKRISIDYGLPDLWKLPKNAYEPSKEIKRSDEISGQPTIHLKNKKHRGVNMEEFVDDVD